MLMNAALFGDILDFCHDQLNSALGAAAVLEVWDGTPPANIADADAGVMIAQLNATNPVFGDLTGNVCDANPFTDDTDTTAGTAAYWRLKNGGGGTTILQWTEGVDFVTDDPAFEDGDTCHISLLEITITVGPPDS